MMFGYIQTHFRNTLCETFHDLACETWKTLLNGEYIGLSLGEETITDNNLFVIQSLHPQRVAIIKFSRYKESKIGADWEWWLGNPSSGWIKMRIQAKKIDPTYLVFKRVDHPNGTCQQIQNLILKSESEGYYPAYCLYNTNLPSRASSWGCTIVPANIMQKALSTKKSNVNGIEFSTIQSSAFHWEKLVCEKETDIPFPRRVQRQLQGVTPSGRQEIVEDCYSEILPEHVERLLSPFYEGDPANIISAIGETVEEPSTKYLAVISDLPIFENRIFRPIDEE